MEELSSLIKTTNILSEITFNTASSATTTATASGSTATMTSASNTSSSSGINLEKLLRQSLQIIFQKSLSNPPGSEKILLILEKIKLLLESMKSNRIFVANYLLKFIQIFAHFYDLATITAFTMTAMYEDLLTISYTSSSATSSDAVTEKINLISFITNTPGNSSNNSNSNDSSNSNRLHSRSYLNKLFHLFAEIIQKKLPLLMKLKKEEIFRILKAFAISNTTASVGNSNSGLDAHLLEKIHSFLFEELKEYQKLHNNTQKAVADSEAVAPTGAAEVNATSNVHKLMNNELVNCLAEIMEEFVNYSIFIEEIWIQEKLLALVNLSKSEVYTLFSLASSSTTNAVVVTINLHELIYEVSPRLPDSTQLNLTPLTCFALM